MSAAPFIWQGVMIAIMLVWWAPRMLGYKNPPSKTFERNSVLGLVVFGAVLAAGLVFFL